MRHLFLAAGLLLGSVLLPADPAAAQGGKKKAAKAEAIDGSLLAAGEYAGVLKNVPGSDRMFTLTLTYYSYQPTPKAAKGRGVNSNILAIVRTQKQVQQAQQQLGRAKTPQQVQQAFQKMQRLQAQLQRQVRQARLALGASYAAAMRAYFKVVTTTQDVDFQATEDVKVRTLAPPEQFDEKGKPKKYTKEELKELKGKDRLLPGFESSPEKLEAGQTVKVTLAARKKAKAAAKEKDADKDVDKAADAETEKKFQVKLIVIHAEASADARRPGGKGKK
jgi:hypothetical protein